MKELFNKLKKLARRVKALLPSKLPQGMTEFDQWSDDVLDIYNMPNNDSTKFSLAVMITHLAPTEAYKPKHYFGLTLVKSASVQVAFAVMDQLKKKQAEKAKKDAEEAAASQVTTANESK